MKNAMNNTASNPYRVELLVDGVWVDSGREFLTEYDATSYGYSRAGFHAVHGYATQDHTWRVRGGYTWSGAARP